MSINLKIIPKSPGVYQFFDKKGNIIYIGKSVNLFSRVNSYFNGKAKLNFAKQKMVNQIDKIETIITNNETESLILETTLIKKHKPKYNILMKDDKNYVYIKITDESIAKIQKVRVKTKTGTYFGPYISTSYVNNIIKLTKKLFGHRSCNIIFGEKINICHPELDSGSIEKQRLNRKKDSESSSEGQNNNIYIKSSNGSKIPCMDYYIKRCAGPCLLEKDKIENYKKSIENIKSFLKGDFKDVLKSLEEKMKFEASKLNFEEAKKIKDYIESVKSLEINQNMRETISGNYKILNYIKKYDKFFIGVIELENSKITGYHNYEIESKLEETSNEILKNFIESDYINSLENKNKFIYLTPEEIPDLLAEIKTEIPKIGNKLELIKLAYKNIYDYAYKKHLASLSTKGFSKQTQINLLEILSYQSLNKNIIFECNDISHISGNHTVASRSIIENGKSNTSKYKKFNIKTLESGKIDDFSSMKEIMTRRLKEIEKTGIIPDLIIIDGGKGQLSSVMKIIEDFKKNYCHPELDSGSIKKQRLNRKKDSETSSEGKTLIKLINSLQLVSLAKREEELFLPGKKESILLDKDSNELRLVQKIRDEAHRFAITFNRDKRIKAMKKNILESLPGFGPKTRKKILNKYGNIEKLREIPKDELKNILNKNQIETLENHSIID